MSTWKGRSSANVLGYQIFVFLLKTAGLAPAYFLLRFVALYYFLFSWKSSAFTWYYFRHRLGFGFWKSLVSLYQNYYIFGQTLIDKVVLMANIPSKIHYTETGEQYLIDLAKAGTGGIMVSAHLGNWEMAGYLLKKLETRVNIVMFDGEQAKIKDYMGEVMTEKQAMNFIFVKEDMSHIYAINNAIANKEIICMHGDRFVEGSKPVLSTFLGKSAYFPTGPFFLAARYGIPVTYVFAMKEKGQRYHFYATPPKTYPSNRSSIKDPAFVQQLIDDYVVEFEKIVRKYPHQWFNYYDFWKI